MKKQFEQLSPFEQHLRKQNLSKNTDRTVINFILRILNNVPSLLR